MGGVNEFFANLPPWLGTLPNWITATGVVTFIGLLLKYRLGKGDLGIKAQQVTIEAGKVEAEIEAKLREHFSGELERLTTEITRITNDHEATRNRQTECETREEKLRARVRKLEADYDGVLKIISLNSSVLLVGEDGRPSEAVRDAAIRVIERLAKGQSPKRLPEVK